MEVMKKPTTVKVMLKLMEGMQAIQRQMLEHRDEDNATESVRQAPALPALSEWSATMGPIDLNDWMALIEPMMCDLSNSSAQWWQQLVMEAHLWYQRHLQLPPLDRVCTCTSSLTGIGQTQMGQAGTSSFDTSADGSFLKVNEKNSFQPKG